MFKNILILLTMIFMAKSYAQVQTGYLGGAEVNSTGLVEVANLRCMGEECIADGQTFMLPFSIELEGNMSGADIANAEVFLTSVMKQEFNEKIKAFDYKGGLKLFGVQLETTGTTFNDTKLLSVNVVRTEFVEQVDLSKDGKKRIIFNLYGQIGISKLTKKFDEYSEAHGDLVEQDHGVRPELTEMNNSFGSTTDIGAAINFQLNNLEISGYTRFMTHTSNNLFGGTADANGIVNKTRYNTFQLGLDLQYNVHTGKNGRQLFIFTNVEYGRYQHSLISGQGDLNIHSMPSATKDLNFKVGIRYTLPTFKKRSKKRF